MNRLACPSSAHRRRVAPVAALGGAVLLLLLPGIARAQWTEREGTFNAYWTVSGNIHILEFLGSTAAAGGHEGNVVLNTSEGSVPGFDTDCVAFTDERIGGIGRCVWTGSMGDQIFVELKSSGPAGFGLTKGTFVGGTGRYDGIQGGFQFEWNYSVSRGKDATFDGHTLRMSGRYRLP